MFRKVTLIIVALVVYHGLMAQGCSDAGFCSIGNIKHSPAGKETSKQKLSIFFANGIGDENVYVFTPGIQYDNKLSEQWAIQAKVTANYASGNLGTAFGLGDVFVAGSFSPKTKSSWKSTVTLATKLPLNSGNIKTNKPLPMQYQSSLGTVDGIIGFTIGNANWKFSTAFQQPLSGRNRNTFLPAYWATTDANKYIPSNDFNRKGDGLLRAGYNRNLSKQLNVSVGLLGIYHIGNDTYIDANVSNTPIEIKGSSGLTLNGTLVADYKVSSKLSLGITAGVPFVVRDKRPDGLTREFVLSPEIIIHF